MDRERLAIPDRASPAETAAIIAAVEAQLATERAQRKTDDEDEDRDGREWTLLARLEAVRGGTVRRIPSTAPSDEWTAAARADRF